MEELVVSWNFISVLFVNFSSLTGGAGSRLLGQHSNHKIRLGTSATHKRPGRGHMLCWCLRTVS
jgi:hypothetical protein